LKYEQDDHVYVSHFDGSQPVELTEGGLSSWSPDSTRIAFSSSRNGSRDIWVIGRDGTGLQQLTDGPEERLGSPVWSPYGKRIVGLDITHHEVFIFNVEIPWSEQERTVIPNLNEHGDHLVVRSWSPDGGRLLGSWPSDHSGKRGIGIYNLDNETYEMVLDFAAVQPRWLSDGRRFLFLSDKDWIERGPLVTGGPPSSLYIGDRVTKEYHKILNLAPDVIWRGYGVTRDDRAIFIPRERRESDIWRLELK
jgi:Tol biopolymer transport system component